MICVLTIIEAGITKMKTQYKTIDEYIKAFPENVQIILEKMRQTIWKVAPEAIEAISYQMPVFKLNGILVYFAAFEIILDSIQLLPELNPLKKNYPCTQKVKGRYSFR